MSDFYSISEIARLSGKDRRTVAARFAHISPAKESANLKQYSIEQIINLVFDDARATGVDNLSPAEELAYWSAKLKELEYKKRMGEVCEVTDVGRQYAGIVKSMLQPQETLPDRAEIAGMPINWVIWLQKEVDQNRNEEAELIRTFEVNIDVCESE